MDIAAKVIHEYGTSNLLISILEDRSILDRLEVLAGADFDGYIKVKYILMHFCCALATREELLLSLPDHVERLRIVAKQARQLAKEADRLTRYSPGAELVRHLQRRQEGRTAEHRRGLRAFPAVTATDRLPYYLNSYADDLVEESARLKALLRTRKRKRSGGPRSDTNRYADVLIDRLDSAFGRVPHALIARMVSTVVTPDISEDAVRKRANARKLPPKL